MKENAPDEIQADLETVSNGFADVQEIFAEYDYDLAKLGAAAAADPELTQRLESFGGEEFTGGQRAREHVPPGGVQPRQLSWSASGATTLPGG